MHTLEGQRVLVTGGSTGFGLGLVEALVARKAQVTVVARDAARLAELHRRLGVAVIAGDVTDRALAVAAIREVRPSVLVLNAGATPAMVPLHEQTWEQFTSTWNTDVKAGLHWVQEAIRSPLERGSRVLLSSSGAAVGGSPLSGGYAGAKRMIMFLAQYANGVSAELDLGIKFQSLAPLQVSGDTDLGRNAAEAYAKRKGISTEAFLAAFGKPMTPQLFGELVVTILTDERYEKGTAFGLKGDTGITSLDG
jgi:hypothetical protein